MASFWGPAYFQGRTVSFREGTIYIIVIVDSTTLSVNIVTFLHFEMIVPSFPWVFCSLVVWFWCRKSLQESCKLNKIIEAWRMLKLHGDGAGKWAHVELEINLETDH